MITLTGLPLLLSSAALSLGAATASPSPAMPEPTLKPGLEEAEVTPGIEGFLFTALMVAMAIIVFRLMVRSVRRVQQRSPDAESMLVERHQTYLDDDVREGGERLDGDADQRLARLQAKYPGYLQDPTPDPQEPDTGRRRD